MTLSHLTLPRTNPGSLEVRRSRKLFLSYFRACCAKHRLNNYNKGDNEAHITHSLLRTRNNFLKISAQALSALEVGTSFEKKQIGNYYFVPWLISETYPN